jgi:hypothetical protein
MQNASRPRIWPATPIRDTAVEDQLGSATPDEPRIRPTSCCRADSRIMRLGVLGPPMAQSWACTIKPHSKCALRIGGSNCVPDDPEPTRPRYCPPGTESTPPPALPPCGVLPEIPPTECTGSPQRPARHSTATAAYRPTRAAPPASAANAPAPSPAPRAATPSRRARARSTSGRGSRPAAA